MVRTRTTTWADSTHPWPTHRRTPAHMYTKLKSLESLSDFKTVSLQGTRMVRHRSLNPMVHPESAQALYMAPPVLLAGLPTPWQRHRLGQQQPPWHYWLTSLSISCSRSRSWRCRRWYSRSSSSLSLISVMLFFLSLGMGTRKSPLESFL